MKEWWQDFFIPVTGEIMFQPRKQHSVLEVSEVVKKTKVPKSAKILDLACGVGRHSIIFSKNGFDVIGLDFSKNYLAEAKASALKAKAKVKFVHGDMKNLKPHFGDETFDLVVSLYNSFGYFKNRSDDMKMLKEVFRVLKPGGKFVINTLNGNGVRQALEKPISVGREPIRNVFMIDAAKFDLKKCQTQSQWTIIDARKEKSKIHRMSFQQNVYSHQQLKTALKKAGFKIETTWGLLQGGPFNSSKTWHQLLWRKSS